MVHKVYILSLDNHNWNQIHQLSKGVGQEDFLNILEKFLVLTNVAYIWSKTQ